MYPGMGFFTYKFRLLGFQKGLNDQVAHLTASDFLAALRHNIRCPVTGCQYGAYSTFDIICFFIQIQ